MFADGATRVEVDGVEIGAVSDIRPLRYFLCAGNHRAHIYLHGADPMEEHEIDFAVARPSLFHLTQYPFQNNERRTCVADGPCFRNVAFELFAYDPDDLQARIYPAESKR